MRRRRRRLLGWVLVGALPALTLLLLLLLLTSSLRGERTFVVEAITTGADITFTGGTEAWTIGRATVCLPRAEPLLAAQKGAGRCDARLYTEAPRSGLMLEWQSGSTVNLRQDRDRNVVLRIGGTTAPLPPGALVFVEPAQWRAAGALTFAGLVVIGEQITSGESSVLLSGSYEARERSWFSGTTETIKSGELRRGERVSVVQRSGTAPGFGHITPVGRDEDGFHLVNIAQPGDTSLQIEYVGGEAPALIRPSWVDHAIRSPVLVALALLLSLCAAVGQVLLGSLEYLGVRPERATRRRTRRITARADVAKRVLRQ